MLGDEQHINGTDVTVFNNLELRATNIKYADLDVVVENELILNDREFNCDTNTVFVTNPDPAIVTSDGGFVSSLSDGGLSREMNTNADYFFPVGSSLGTVRYRPVFLEPNFPNGNTFKVRFANTDATLEGFDRELREPNICEVNPEYYLSLIHI